MPNMRDRELHRKGDITLRALEIINQLDELADDAIESTVNMSLKPTWGRLMINVDRKLASNHKQRQMVFKDLRQVNNLLSHLKRLGYVSGTPKKLIPMLTKEGKVKLAILQEKDVDVMPAPQAYKKIQAGNVKIVIFDLDESQRNKRNWLRNVLRYLGFKLLRRSVWQGKGELPPQLLKDLERMNIIDSIHIFTVQENNLLE